MAVFRHICAFIAMACGTIGVIGLMTVISRGEVDKAQHDHKKAVAMAVKAPRKRRPKPKSPKPKKRRSKARRTARAPAPKLQTGLSGVDVGGAMGGLDLGLDSDELVAQGAAAKNLVMTEGSVDRPPRPVQRVAPRYPPRARARGVQGKIVLSLLVGASGQVERVKVLEAQPAGVFDEAAQDAVRQWRFVPAEYQGRPVKVWARQTLRFKLT